MKTLESAQAKVVSKDSGGDRLADIKHSLFVEVAARFGRAFAVEDKMVFAMLLSKIFGCVEELPDTNLSVEVISEFITNAFGDGFPWQGRGLNDLSNVTANEITAAHPLLLCSAPGHDVSGRIDVMARTQNKELASVAMGSAEGFATAERMVMTASKRGTWVLLKNCHLCTEWLEHTLVKKIQGLGSMANSNFRLFITSEISPNLPTALLRMCDMIVAEAPSGIKASLTRFTSNISIERYSSPIRNRLYLLLGWTHAVIQERLRYIPTGWSEAYEFTEADALHALDVVDALLDDTSDGKQSTDPELLPWDAIRTTLCKGIFGGRITKDSDQKILDNLVSGLFVPSCFDVNFKLIEGDDAPCLPDGTSMNECLAWISSLSEYTPPTWIGLAGSAETARSESIAKSVIAKVDKVEKIMSSE
jgi:dynein heavy chain 1